MRRAVCLLAALLVGCNPIPNRQECLLPQFAEADAMAVHARYDTSSYFSSSCPVAAPKSFTLRTAKAELDLDILVARGARLYLRAKSKDQRRLSIHGDRVYDNVAPGFEFTHHSPLGLPDQQRLHLDLRTSDESLVDTVDLEFGTIRCTCVSYDSL
jgi:hypothetical protein